MRRILVTADLHLNDKPRDQYRHDWVATLPDLLIANRVDTLLILGDLTDEKDHHGSWLVNTMVHHFTRLAEICPIIVVKGNHDYVEANLPFYGWLKRLPSVTWINKPKYLWKERLLLLPHTPDWKKDWAKLNLDDVDLIGAHATFSGASARGHKLSGIPPDLFNGIRVISGDIHEPQDIGNITYVGAPYTIDFGDNYKPRVMLLHAGQEQSIPCTGPQKRLVDFTVDAKPTNPTGLVTDFASYAGPPLQKGDLVKVRVALSPALYSHWPAVKVSVRAWAKEQGLVLCQVQPIVDTKTLTRRGRPKVRSDDQLLVDYAVARGVDETTLKTGQRLMRNVP